MRERESLIPSRLSYREKQRLTKIERTLRHAQATRPTDYDSWLNGYQDDVAWLVARLKERTDA